MNKLKAIAIAATALMLTACGEPSGSDIQKVLEARIKTQAEQTRNIGVQFGSPGATAKMADQIASTKVLDVHKIGCKPDGDNAFICDYDAEISRQGKTRKLDPTQIRLVKSSDGWAASN